MSANSRRSPLVLILCAAIATGAGATATVASAAEPLPAWRQFPADAQSRLDQAVRQRVQVWAGAWFEAAFDGVSDRQLAHPENRRSLWESIEGSLTGPPVSGIPHPTPLLEVVDGAIDAYMTELGRLAHELDRSGATDPIGTLAPLHPGAHGGGSIEVGRVGPFRGLTVTFRGEIAHPGGRSPAVVALFYLMPQAKREPPVPARLLIPVAGAEPSFRAPLRTGDAGGPGDANAGGELRDYGWRPRLMRTRSILELRMDGRWIRVEDELDALLPERRKARDPKGFCDASCAQR